LRLVLSAGAPVPVATLRSTAALCPAAGLHTPYGMTECLPVADIELGEIEAAVLSDTGVGGVCVGRPVAGVDLLIAPLSFDASVTRPKAWPARVGPHACVRPLCNGGRRCGPSVTCRSTSATTPTSIGPQSRAGPTTCWPGGEPVARGDPVKVLVTGAGSLLARR